MSDYSNKLANTLTQKQVDAANRLAARMSQWRPSEQSLLRLRDTLPGWDKETCLIKSVVINSLYSTQVFAIVRMAEHIHEVLNDTDLNPADVSLVEEMAELTDDRTGKKRRFISFAAKFCHFFIDEKRYPIYDEVARDSLLLHLGSQLYVKDNSKQYHAFCENLNMLRDTIRISASTRQLDRYLWIIGSYMKWLKIRINPKLTINVELLRVLEKPDAETAADLDALLPNTLERAFKSQS